MGKPQTPPLKQIANTDARLADHLSAHDYMVLSIYFRMRAEVRRGKRHSIDATIDTALDEYMQGK